MKIRSVEQAGKLAGKRVLCRVDFNVPLKKGKIVDDFKLIKTLPTIQYLLDQKAQIIIVSHLGRPTKVDSKYSLKSVAHALEKYVARKVLFTTLEKMEKQKTAAPIVFLENIRFYKDEEKNTFAFAKRLAALADIFVLDGFGVSHRSAASVVGVAGMLPSYAGLLLGQEIASLTAVSTKPKKPLVVVLGGAKMETKIPVLEKLLPLADHILIGGAMANTYYYAQGSQVGASLVEKDGVAKMLELAKNKKIVFPIDAVYGTPQGTKVGVIPTGKEFVLPNKQLGIYDIGPATIQLFSGYLKDATTIVWNGALGFFEQRPYQYGTFAIAEVLARRAKGKAFGVAGGGETVEVLKKLGLLDDIDLVSTGGGAMLEYLSGKSLPGIEALKS